VCGPMPHPRKNEITLPPRPHGPSQWSGLPREWRRSTPAPSRLACPIPPRPSRDPRASPSRCCHRGSMTQSHQSS